MKKQMLMLALFLIALAGCREPDPQYRLVMDFMKAVSRGDTETVSTLLHNDGSIRDEKMKAEIIALTKKRDLLAVASKVALVGYGTRELERTQNPPGVKRSLNVEFDLNFCVVYLGMESVKREWGGGGYQRIPVYKICYYEGAGLYKLKKK